jgi:hypothetical protein
VLNVKKHTTVSIGDITALSVSAILMILIVAIPLFKNGFDKPGSVLTLVNKGVDDASHIGLLNDRLQFNRGVIAKSNVEGQTRSAGVASYPAGWHSANAVIIKALSPSLKTGADSITAYVVSKIFWFALLIFLFVRSIFAIFNLLSNKIPSAPAVLAIFLLSLLFSVWSLVDIFSYGFYSFIPQLIIVPIFVLSLIQLHNLPKSNTPRELHLSLILPLLLCAGTALTWLLLLPVFFLATVITITYRIKKVQLKNFVKQITKAPISFIIFYSITLLALIVQIYASTKSDGSVSFIQGILIGGGIITYPLSLYCLIALGCTILFSYHLRKQSTNILSPILNYVFATVLFISLLYLIQQYYLQTNAYYYFKALSTLTITLSILSIIGFTMLIDKIKSNTSTSIAMMFVVIFTSLSLQFVYQNPPIFSYIHGRGNTTEAINSQLWNILQTTYTQDKYTDQSITIYYPDDSPGLNEVGSMLLKSNKPHSKCFSAIKTDSFKVSPSNFSIETLLNCTNDEKIIYYVKPYDVEKMKAILKTTDLSDRIKVRSIAG